MESLGQALCNCSSCSVLVTTDLAMTTGGVVVLAGGGGTAGVALPNSGTGNPASHCMAVLLDTCVLEVYLQRLTGALRI